MMGIASRAVAAKRMDVRAVASMFSVAKLNEILLNSDGLATHATATAATATGAASASNPTVTAVSCRSLLTVPRLTLDSVRMA
jgi:hypothetical protein